MYNYSYSVLILAEKDFKEKGRDTEAYLEKLTSFLNKRAGETSLKLATVEGKYNVGCLDAIPVDDRNKTAFIKSLEDYLPQFDEIVIITNFEGDIFINAVTNKASELSKSFTVYGFETKI